ncbi:hypothetical protein HY632_03870 [Candidatus Uhrbacteria bacterium]|nr:hypothetical protein [Candidatus Uhrbacteria bacterium]
MAEAAAREKELLESGCALVLMEDLSGRIKPATHYVVRAGRRSPRPFRDQCPEEAAYLEELAQLDHPIRVYCIERGELPEAIHAALRDLRLRAIRASAANA